VLSLTPLANLRQKITFLLWGKQYDAELSLSGQFQAENTLTALMLVLASNPNSWENPLAVEPYLPQLAGLDAIRGRLEKIDNSNHPAHFFVDYAHTETALATTLAALRPLTRGRLIVVFGCGGNRDPFKRAKMGKVAAEMADVAIITDDNPRHEDPRTIRAAILSACPKGIEATSRQEAIGTAVAMAEMGDIVLVAGKGHETGQIVGDNILPFDDAVVIKNMIDNHAQR
ncbi:MAG: UDP-N-acetylmuramoyl-L-alanyl-D-glutamate--2,6-diaminopimelate ligase, partial [Alphaproteobacteria bacterium]|nr:UDP-N-acetylmuramoyl-L-alanyl-D-glutamate--2,6-diaminopimelate ligase [Alphaproteobacteria bacterium]